MIRALLPLAAFAAVIAPTVALAQVSVPVHQVRRLSFPGAAADVVVGDPDIAEVTVVDGRNVFVTGRSPGTTSVIVLDGAGRIIFNDRVQVARGGGGAATGVSVTRATEVVTLACDPRCEDTPPESGASAAATPGGAGMPSSPVGALRALLPQSGSAAGSSAAAAPPAASTAAGG